MRRIRCSLGVEKHAICASSRNALVQNGTTPRVDQQGSQSGFLIVGVPHHVEERQPNRGQYG